MPDLMDTARELASRPYITIVLLDETTDGDPIYVALNPELKGLIVQGETVEEARGNLNETRVEFILDMLEDGLDIPGPQKIHGTFMPGSIGMLAVLPPKGPQLVPIFPPPQRAALPWI